MSGRSVPAGCTRVRGRVERRLDGDLAPLDEALDRGHLEACEGCRREHEEAEELLRGIRAEASRALSSDRLEHERVERFVLARVARADLAHEPAPRRDRRLSGAALRMAAAVLALVLLQASGLGIGAAPTAADLASLDSLWRRLPTWTDLVHGVAHLSRHLS